MFAVLLVAASFLLSMRIDVATLARRQRRGKSQLLNRADPISRLVKVVLGGLVIPVAAFVAANLVTLGDHTTPMSLAIEAGTTAPRPLPAALVGNAVRRATDPAVKVQGIVTLQAMGSSEALEQLFGILAEDPAALTGRGRVPGALQGARRIRRASHGRARPPLRAGEPGPAPGRRRVPPAMSFERYFGGGFAGLANDIRTRTIDPAAQAAALARLETAERELELALTGLEPGAPAGTAGPGLPGFVMQTLLQMNDRPGADLLAFARRTAADTGWSDAVRGEALLLIGKLGGKDELEALYGFLDAPSPLLQARAMQAIAAVQLRVAPAAGH